MIMRPFALALLDWLGYAWRCLAMLGDAWLCFAMLGYALLWHDLLRAGAFGIALLWCFATLRSALLCWASL